MHPGMFMGSGTPMVTLRTQSATPESFPRPPWPRIPIICHSTTMHLGGFFKRIFWDFLQNAPKFHGLTHHKVMMLGIRGRSSRGDGMGQRGRRRRPESTNMSGMYSVLSIPILNMIRYHERSLSRPQQLFLFYFPDRSLAVSRSWISMSSQLARGAHM